MSGKAGSLYRAAPSGFENGVQSNVRLLRPERDRVSFERQVKRDFIAIVVRMWLVSVLILIAGALAMAIVEKFGTRYFAPPTLPQSLQPKR
jgi:Na+/H+ antiporter NhaB